MCEANGKPVDTLTVKDVTQAVTQVVASAEAQVAEAECSCRSDWLSLHASDVMSSTAAKRRTTSVR